MPPKKAPAAPKAPTKEQLLFVTITSGDEAEAIRLIDEGVSLTKQGPNGNTPIQHAIQFKRWNVFAALLNKGAKFTCDAFYALIDILSNADTVDIIPIRTVFEKSPGFFLQCNQNRIDDASLWHPVFRGSEDFIKAFIDLVKEKASNALKQPAGPKMPLVIGLMEENPDEGALVSGLKYLITKAGINVNSSKRNDNPITIVTLMEATLTLPFIKRCISVGYNINKEIYAIDDDVPIYKTNLLEGLLTNRFSIVHNFPYLSPDEPTRTDPDTDLLSFLLDNTPDFVANPNSYISPKLYEHNPQIFIRVLMKLKSINNLERYFVNGYYSADIQYGIHTMVIKNYWAALQQILELRPSTINAKLNSRGGTSNKYSYLIHTAARNNKLAIAKRLLALGADPMLKDSENKIACDYARESGNPEMIALVCPPEEPSPAWRGLTRSNIEKYNYIFNKERGNKPRAVAENHSFCPICLTDAERSVACNHMQHNCAKDNPERYHKDLYNRFKDARGNVHWCTLCGRICAGLIDDDDHAFVHYNLASAADAAAGKATLFNPGGGHIQGDAYTHDCSLTVYDSGDKKGQPIPLTLQSGGGGLREKFLRIHRLRQYAHALRATNEKDAYKKLIEQTWNAPLVGALMNRPELENIKGPNSWNISTSAFRVNVETVAEDPRPRPPAAAYSDLKRSACEAEVTLIVTTGMNMTSLNNLNDKGNKGCQFRHMEEDADGKSTGHMNLHEDSPFLIRTVMDRVANYVKNFSGDYFGRCIDPKICKARIFPEDLVPLLGHGFPQELYEEYRELFNWRFGGARLLEGIKSGGEPGPAAVLVQALGGGGGGPANIVQVPAGGGGGGPANVVHAVAVNAANAAAIQALLNENNQAGGKRTRRRKMRKVIRRKTRR